MSFKIFSLQLTGKIKPTASVEKQREQLATDYAAFLKTESSAELKAFIELESTVNSDQFKAKQKEIESLTFKGSKEENQLKELERLKKSSPIKKYFQVVNSSDLKRFEKERDSEKMKSYYLLLDYMKDGQFEKDKKEITSQIFKSSVEEKHLLEYRKLSKSAGIKAYFELSTSSELKKHESLTGSEKLKKLEKLKNTPGHSKEEKAEFRRLKSDSEIKHYFRFENSKKYKLYKETRDSHDLKRYQELKSLVESKDFKEREAFLKDKHKFDKSEAAKKQNEFKRLSADEMVKFVLKYEKSPLYKNYLDVTDSHDLKRYYELEEIISSEAYKKQKAWLEDKKRWEKTPEYQQQIQYQKEKQKPEFVNFFKYRDSNAFDFFRNWEVAFEDNFADKTLDLKKWSTSGAVAARMLGKNYAVAGDLNIFTEGANIRTGNKLVIQAKKEKAKGMLWKMPAGFVPAEFEYTSGIVSTSQSFKMENGILEAKIKFDPVKTVISSLYLAGDDSASRANLIEMGARNNLGFSVVNEKGKVESHGLEIANLKKGYYIFSLEKQDGSYTWKINGTEVLKQDNRELNKPLYLEASSLVIEPFAGTGPDFDIEWVKCYIRK